MIHDQVLITHYEKYDQKMHIQLCKYFVL